MSLTMLDSIDVQELIWAIENGHKPDAVAGYVAGNWPTYPVLQQIVRKYLGLRLLSIAVNASEDAECLDVETGDATPDQAPVWVRRQLGRGIWRPVVYASASLMGTVLGRLAASGVKRSQVRLWSAHYTPEPHICGPATCAYPGCPACDGTQWASSFAGHNIDRSVLLTDFFGKPDPAPPPETTHVEDPMLLNKGKGATTPLSLPTGAKSVRFFSNMPAEVRVDTRDGHTHDLKLGYDSAHAVDVPKGINAFVVHRIDAGSNDVSAAVTV